MKRLVFLFFLVSFSYSASVADIATLEQLYNDLDGPNWTDRTSWLSGDPCINTWAGITCDASDNIINIELPNNGLEGVFPSDFSISSLQVLYVYLL